MTAALCFYELAGHSLGSLTHPCTATDPLGRVKEIDQTFIVHYTTTIRLSQFKKWFSTSKKEREPLLREISISGGGGSGGPSLARTGQCQWQPRKEKEGDGACASRLM